MLFLLLVSGLCTLPFTHSQCQDGWSQFGSRCFRIFTRATDWESAEQNCVSVGGHLASVHSSEEYAFIQALVLNATNSNSLTWLGATDVVQEREWVWTDGSAFDYVNWSPEQPDNYGTENCLEMNFKVNWNDMACHRHLPYVCARLCTLPFTHSQCQDGWSQFGSRCFRIFTRATDWESAEQNCVSVGGHLASVHSSEEYAFIQALVLNATNSNSLTWLGATDVVQEREWVWTDGSAFDYVNWSPEQPDNYGTENCLEMNFKVNWNDMACHRHLPYVCAQTITTKMVLQLKVNSSKDLMTPHNSQLFLQQLKEKLIDRGLPNNFTLRLRTIQNKCP